MNMNLQHMGIEVRKILMRVYREGPDAFGYAKYLISSIRTLHSIDFFIQGAHCDRGAFY